MLDWNRLRSWATGAVIESPDSLTRRLADEFNVSRKTANVAVRRLESEGVLIREHGTTHPRFSPGNKRWRDVEYTIEQTADENQCWVRDFEPYFNLSQNVRGICQHGFTEILNNAHDHSAGSRVHALMIADSQIAQILVADDGVGVFQRIADALGLPDLRLALLELSKGKLTTDPSKHSGEGVFFTSRMFDNFELRANGLKHIHTVNQAYDLLLENGTLQGTCVVMSIALNSKRTRNAVYDEFTSGEEEDFGFEKTVVPVRLARIGQEGLVSRSQAKRLIARFEQFKVVVLDFRDVTEIGQAFADEIFRVFVRSHPEVQLLRTNSAAVEPMILRVSGVKHGQG